MTFSDAQVQEIEDRVNNLIQAATTVLELLASGVEVDSGSIRAARVDLRRLARWTQELRPRGESYRKNSILGYTACPRCGEGLEEDRDGRPRCMYCGYVKPERRH